MLDIAAYHPQITEFTVAFLMAGVVARWMANLRARIGLQKVDVFVASGMSDSARATLTALAAQFKDNPRLTQRIKDRMGRLK